MSYSIIWMQEAFASFDDRIEYLNTHWSQKEINKFKARVTEYLSVLAMEPLIGKKEKLKNVYIGLLIKQVSLIYRVKEVTKEIELISFIDNRQNPRKVKKYKT